jgi:hypothetical protein
MKFLILRAESSTTNIKNGDRMDGSLRRKADRAETAVSIMVFPKNLCVAAVPRVVVLGGEHENLPLQAHSVGGL